MTMIKHDYNNVELSGKNFNEMFPNIKLLKLTNNEENHNGFQFKDGLNIDNVPFNPSNYSSLGGLYFVEECYAHHWIHYGDMVKMKTMVNIRTVTIPDDARVYIEYDRLKADKIILGPKTEINKEIYMKALKKIGTHLQYVPIHLRDEDICTTACLSNRIAFQYIPDSLHEKIWNNIKKIEY